MPVSIDHDERRRYVCDIAARLISRAGVEGVTVRDVAAEAGCSTRIISHYFRNKRELLLLTFSEFSQRSLNEGEAALASGADLQSCLEALLPLDEKRRLSWQVWLAFWGKTANDPEFLAEQVKRGRQISELIARLFAHRCKTHPDAPANWDFIAEHVLTVIVGIATQGTFDPQHWTADLQRTHLRHALNALWRDRGFK
ncbi:MAG: TetR/AcrR family transcriptional regulator [Novosphingobium sp.]